MYWLCLAQGEIGYGEFSQLWSGLQGFCSTEARRMFDKFDTDGSGEIDRYAPDNAPLRLMRAAESRLDAIESEVATSLGSGWGIPSQKLIG